MKIKFSKKLLALVVSLTLVSGVFGVHLNAYADDTADKAAAAAVIKMINDIPGVITVGDCTNVTNARRYYISLTAAQQALVTNYSKLTAAEPSAAKFPGQITATVTQDPAHSMTFTWTTKDTTMTNPVVKIWEASEPESTAVTINATTRLIPAQANSKYITGDTNSYTATANGLKPNTDYNYSVGTNDYMSYICFFKTAPIDNSNFTFTMLADVQIPLGAAGSLPGNDTFAAVASKYPDSAFTYFAGDFTDLASQYEWNGFFGTGGNKLFQNFMAVGVEGNHENTGYDGATMTSHLDTNAELFNEHFNFPSVTYNGKTLRNCYSFDYGPVHFMAVNTNYSDLNLGFNPTIGLKEMAAWLDSDASASNKPWKILLLHKTLYSGGTHAPMTDLTELRKALTPIINKDHIDAVLGGHDHCFARGFVDATGAKVNPTILDQSSSSFQILSSPQGSASPTTTPGAIYTLQSITETVEKPDAPLYFMNGTAGGLKWYAQNPDYVKTNFKVADGDPFTKNYSYLDRDSTESPNANIQEQFYTAIDVTPYSLKFDTYVYNYSIDPTASNAVLYDSLKILNYKAQVSDATDSVAKAEGSKLTDDVNKARDLVKNLNSADQMALNERLDEVQKLINATNAVVKAEGSKLMDDVNKARTLVKNLNSTDQIVLKARLDEVQRIINATNAVVNAEKHKKQSYVNKAQNSINALAKSSTKTSLQNRLNVLKKKYKLK